MTTIKTPYDKGIHLRFLAVVDAILEREIPNADDLNIPDTLSDEIVEAVEKLIADTEARYQAFLALLEEAVRPGHEPGEAWQRISAINSALADFKKATT